MKELQIRSKSGRVELIEGFVVDIEKYTYILKSNITEKTGINSDGEEVISESCSEHGFFQDMEGCIKRLSRELTKRKVNTFERSVSFKEYVEVVKETNRLLEELCKTVGE